MEMRPASSPRPRLSVPSGSPDCARPLKRPPGQSQRVCRESQSAESAAAMTSTSSTSADDPGRAAQIGRTALIPFTPCADRAGRREDRPGKSTTITSTCGDQHDAEHGVQVPRTTLSKASRPRPGQREDALDHDAAAEHGARPAARRRSPPAAARCAARAAAAPCPPAGPWRARCSRNRDSPPPASTPASAAGRSPGRTAPASAPAAPDGWRRRAPRRCRCRPAPTVSNPPAGSHASYTLNSTISISPSQKQRRGVEDQPERA